MSMRVNAQDLLELRGKLITTKKGRGMSHLPALLAKLEALEAQTDFTEVLPVRTNPV